MADHIPFNVGFAKSPPELATLSAMLGGSQEVSPERQYSLFSEASMVAECVEYILCNPELFCPIHQVSLNGENRYKNECLFVRSFETLFGLGMGDFYKIPLATKEDIELFQNE